MCKKNICVAFNLKPGIDNINTFYFTYDLAVQTINTNKKYKFKKAQIYTFYICQKNMYLTIST